MVFLVRVEVKLATLGQFGAALQRGELDNSRVRGDTWCLKESPAVGYSVWETADRDEFERRFAAWRQYYESVEVREVIAPRQAMAALSG